MEHTTSDTGRHVVRLIAALILLVALVAVCLDNRREIRVDYLVGDLHAPLFGVLLVTAVAGALVGWLLLHRPGRRH